MDERILLQLQEVTRNVSLLTLEVRELRQELKALKDAPPPPPREQLVLTPCEPPKPNRRKLITDGMTTLFKEARGVPYVFQKAKDAQAVTRLLELFTSDEALLSRWIQALTHPRWPCHSISEFSANPNRYIVDVADVRRGRVAAETQKHDPRYNGEEVVL